MIGLEAMVTLAGTLVAGTLFLFQIVGNTVRGAKLKRDLEELNSGGFEDSIKLKPGKGYLKKNTIGFLCQVFFGLILVIGFTYWTVYLYLLGQGLTWWAILSGTVAFISLVMLVFASKANKNRNNIIDQLISAMDSVEKSLQPQEIASKKVEEEFSIAAAKVKPVAGAVSVRQMLWGRKFSFGRVPEDSLLRRHFLSNLRAEIESGKAPRPTDSSLCRHYQQMIDAEVENSLAELEENFDAGAKQALKVVADTKSKSKAWEVYVRQMLRGRKYSFGKIPEDSMLRRHFLSNLRAEIESGKDSCPTDSALRRHYEQMINAEVEKCLAEQGFESAIPDKQLPTAASTTGQDAGTVIADNDLREVSPKEKPPNDGIVPEDSMLKRHFLTNLRSLIAANKPLRPTDSVLRRHYDHMIDVELEKRLEEGNTDFNA